MKKNAIIRNVIIICVIIAGLFCGIVLLNKTDDTENEPAVHSVEPMDVYTAYKIAQTDIQKFTVKSETNNLIVKNSGDSKWSINDIPYEKLDTSKVDSLVSNVSAMISNHEIEKEVKDLSVYGLDNPYVTIEITNKSGQIDTLLIGEKSPTLGEYFFIKKGDTTVYTIYEYKVETLVKPIIYYQSFNRFNIDVNDITEITLERYNRPTVQVRLKDNEEGQSYNIVWEIIKPYNGVFNGIDQFINDKILLPISEVSISNPAPENIDYGFDNPKGKVNIVVEKYNEDGTTQKPYIVEFLIGKSVDNKSYVKFENNVYEVMDANLDFVFVDEFLVVSKLQALVDIQSTDNVVVTAHGKSTEISIGHNDDNTFNFTVNGKEANEKYSKRVYQSIIALDVDGLYNNEPLGSKDVEIKYNGYNGNKDNIIELYSINDLSYALSRNGEIHFVIRKSKIDNMIKGLEEYVANPTTEVDN